MESGDDAGSKNLIIFFKTQEDWMDWLDREHASHPGVWVQLAKKAAGIPSLSYDEALEVALCYGWIDGQKKGYDESFWLQKFTPRRTSSKWSKINREKAEQLIADGRMQAAGLAQIEAAKRNGEWDAAYDPQTTATVPDDLQAALDRNVDASAFFDALDSRNRYAILHRIQTAKKAETRQKRIRQYVAMLEKGEKLYP